MTGYEWPWRETSWWTKEDEEWGWWTWWHDGHQPWWSHWSLSLWAPCLPHARAWPAPGYHGSSDERCSAQAAAHRFYVHSPIINNEQKDNFSRFLSLRHAARKLMKKLYIQNPRPIVYSRYKDKELKMRVKGFILRYTMFRDSKDNRDKSCIFDFIDRTTHSDWCAYKFWDSRSEQIGWCMVCPSQVCIKVWLEAHHDPIPLGTLLSNASSLFPFVQHILNCLVLILTLTVLIAIFLTLAKLKLFPKNFS